MIFILLFVSSLAFADVAWFPVGKDGASTNYYSQEKCKAAEGVACYDVGSCPLDECKLTDGKLAIDEALVEAKAAAIVAAEIELAAKIEKEQQITDQTKSCLAVTDNPEASLDEIRQCVVALVKLVAIDHFTSGQL